MDTEKVKDHLKITGIVALVVFIVFSYIVGSFNHSVASSDDRGMAAIVFVLASIILNYMYYEHYTNTNTKNEK